MSDELVGAFVTVTLVSDVTVQGTIFTYDKQNAALVLLQQPTSDRPTVKIVNTCFVKNVTVHERYPKDPSLRLPSGVAPNASLPSFGEDNLQKKVRKTILTAEARRQYPTEYDVSIAACQLYDKLVVACGQATFSQDPNLLKSAKDAAAKQGAQPSPFDYVIVVGEHIVVSSNGGDSPAWENAIVTDISGTQDQLANRVRAACHAAFKN